MAYKIEEQETTCNYDYMAKEWTIYTCVRRHITRLYKISPPYWMEEELGDNGQPRIIAGKWTLKMSQVRFAKIIDMSGPAAEEEDNDDEQEEQDIQKPIIELITEKDTLDITYESLLELGIQSIEAVEYLDKAIASHVSEGHI